MKKKEKNKIEEFINELTKIKASDIYELYKLSKIYEGTIIGDSIELGLQNCYRIKQKWGEKNNE